MSLIKEKVKAMLNKMNFVDIKPTFIILMVQLSESLAQGVEIT